MKQPVRIATRNFPPEEYSRQSFQEYYGYLASVLSRVTYEAALGYIAIDDTDSPYTVTRDDEIIYADTTNNNVTVTLPEISQIMVDARVEIVIKKKVVTNTLTVSRSGSDNIDESTSTTLTAAGEVKRFRAADLAQWLVI